MDIKFNYFGKMGMGGVIFSSVSNSNNMYVP